MIKMDAFINKIEIKKYVQREGKQEQAPVITFHGCNSAPPPSIQDNARTHSPSAVMRISPDSRVWLQ